MRKDAREVVYKTLYAYNLTGEFQNELFDELSAEAELSADDKAFATKLLNTIEENYGYISETVGNLAVNYMLDRIYITDKCALFIGIAEMTYFESVPNIVAIDEALSLCKKYSTEKSLGFVNGIFARYKSMIENT